MCVRERERGCITIILTMALMRCGDVSEINVVSYTDGHTSVCIILLSRFIGVINKGEFRKVIKCLRRRKLHGPVKLVQFA